MLSSLLATTKRPKFLKSEKDGGRARRWRTRLVARNLGHLWEVLTFDRSIMRVVILQPIGREQTRISPWHRTMSKMRSVRGTRGKRSVFFIHLEDYICGRRLCRVEAKETHHNDCDRFFEVEMLSWPAAEFRQNFAQISCLIGYQ